MIKKYQYNNANIYIRSQKESERLILRQSNTLQTLDKFKGNALLNCSYFTSTYVLGRNQGDIKNDYQDKDDIYDVIIFKDNTYKIADFNSWDYIDKNNIALGFSVPCVLIDNFKDVEYISTAIVNKTKLTNYNPQSALFKADGVYHFLATDGRGNVLLNGYDLRSFLKIHFKNIEMLVLLDGGGSTHLIDNNQTINKLANNHKRSMFNALAFIDKPNNQSDFDISVIDERFTCLMAHFKKVPNFKKGDKIYYGDYIGEMGNSGISKGVHLHLAVFETITDDLPYLKQATPSSKYKPNRKECEYFKDDDLFINQGIKREALISCGWLGYENHYAIDYIAKGKGYDRYPLIHWNRSYVGTVINVGFNDRYGYFISIAYGKNKQNLSDNNKPSINTLEDTKTSENQEILRLMGELELKASVIKTLNNENMQLKTKLKQINEISKGE